MAYIPRSSLMSTGSESAIPLQVKRRHTIRVFNLITTTLLVLSLLSAVGVFLYKDYVVAKLNDARTKLDTLSASMGEQSAKKIEEIRVYDNKLNIAHTLLDNHLSPTALLREIESSTKETVQFTDFQYVYDPGYEVMLTLSGNTEVLTSAALQKMQILKDGIFSQFAFSDIDLAGGIDSSGQGGAGVQSTKDGLEEKVPAVTFEVKGIFKKSLMEYEGATSTPKMKIRGASSTPLYGATTPIGTASTSISTSTLPAITTESI